MPTGIIINTIAIAAGGIFGAVIGDKIPKEYKDKMNMIFGACAMSMGVSSIVLMENMPAVVFAVILGTLFGMVIHLEDKIHQAAQRILNFGGKFIKTGNNCMANPESMSVLLTVIVLFCASGTGIYGSLVSGMDGDHSILIAKSILDLFTALIFACTLGMAVAAISVLQFIVFFTLFLLAGVIYPMTTPVMINDFKACGGIIMLATGFRMIQVKMFPTADMIPAMVLVMPLSWAWIVYILPLVR